MTIGEGILWSTIVLVLFAWAVLLTKHKRWVMFLKVIAYLALIGLAIGLGIAIYDKYENRPQVAFSLSGITLGMSELAVTLAKGKPDRVLDFAENGDEDKKILIYGDSIDIILRGEQESIVVTNICDHRGHEKVLGFSTYDSEKELLEKLGNPDKISVNQEGTRKFLSFSQWNAAFEIEKGIIVTVCITSRPQMNYLKEYGSARAEE